ncbi:MAG: hypothetical protein D6797_08235 [Bdellovibrio sp.]|nr:MAG: hypothetical protein D6797_08235 [Bdellovibrio sp.]
MANFGDFLLVKMEIKDKDGATLEEGREEGDVYIYGLNSILPVVDREVALMKEGEVRDIKAMPEEAYGPKNPDLIKTLPASNFKEKPSQGELIEMNSGGRTFKGIVKKVEGGRVTVDFNHPYAGKELLFHIEVKKIAREEKPKIELILHQFDAGKDVDVDWDGKKLVVKSEDAYKNIAPTMSYLFPEYKLELKAKKKEESQDKD